MTELLEQLELYGELDYKMKHIDHETFWKFWGEHGKPPVTIKEIDFDHIKHIPSDVVLTLAIYDDENIDIREFLHRAEHVQDLTCNDVSDYVIQGYTGHAKIDAITVRDLQWGPELPLAKYYYLNDVTGIGTNFDCHQGIAYIFKIPDPAPSGYFRRLLTSVVNFSEFFIDLRHFTQFYREIPEIAHDPNIIICIFATVVFNASIFNNVRIENLRLHSYRMFGEGQYCGAPDNFQVGNLVECSEPELFRDLIQHITRYKKTKSAATQSA